jgi:hypothetical protein
MSASGQLSANARKQQEDDIEVSGLSPQRFGPWRTEVVA